ncbi:MAG: diaminopimelate decarboxylase [Caldilineales bacterium]|nr:diaminopimelate decarboxylase [Caldilineales bacterium]
MFPFHLWPLTAHFYRGRLYLRHLDLADVATELGTPLYLYDATTIEHAIAAYRRGLRAWPGEARLAYAAKAWFTLAMAQFLDRRRLGLEVVSEGELAIAEAAGFPPESIHVHGNNKSPALLRRALELGVGAIVLDNLDELDRLEVLAAAQGLTTSQAIWLRLNPDLVAPTHPYRQTGHYGAKFGLSPDEALTAAGRIARHPDLKLVGVHVHIGSQIFDLEPILAACERLIELATALRQRGHVIRFLSPGGGLGQPYHPDDPRFDLVQAVERVARHCAEVWERQNGRIEPPTLVLEPGRSLIARAGVALYTVGSVRRLADGSRIVAVDGSMADNIRPALYGARYTACLPARPLDAASGPCRIVGPLCESGDVLLPAVALPDVRPGDILAVPVSGAYQLSMASNYNAALAPAVYWLEDDHLLLIQRRQRPADLLQRDLPLPP